MKLSTITGSLLLATSLLSCEQQKDITYTPVAKELGDLIAGTVYQFDNDPSMDALSVQESQDGDYVLCNYVESEDNVKVFTMDLQDKNGLRSIIICKDLNGNYVGYSELNEEPVNPNSSIKELIPSPKGQGQGSGAETKPEIII